MVLSFLDTHVNADRTIAIPAARRRAAAELVTLKTMHGGLSAPSPSAGTRTE
jgi:hypothetical protein